MSITTQRAPDGAWETHTCAPHPALRPLMAGGYAGYVERLARPLARREVPIGAIPVIIGFGAPVEIEGWGVHRSFLAGLDDAASLTRQVGEQVGIQVNLTALGARTLLGLPLGEIARQVVALDALLPAGLTDNLGNRDGWAARFSALDAFWLARLAAGTRPRPDVARAWGRLAATHGSLGVAALCAELRCSRRHLTRRFGQEVGLPPKAVARILRFRRVLSLLEAEDGAARWADIAAGAGYADQPHLHRDFVALAGCTPGGYLAARLPDERGVAAAVPNVQDGAVRTA